MVSVFMSLVTSGVEHFSDACGAFGDLSRVSACVRARACVRQGCMFGWHRNTATCLLKLLF